MAIAERRLGVPSSAERRLGVPSSAERRLGVPSSAEQRLGVPSIAEQRLGVGLRAVHYEEWLSLAVEGSRESFPACAEIITENVLRRGGRPRAVVEKVRAQTDLFLHGVSLSIGGPDPLDEVYLRDLAQLAKDVAPAFVSDHVCFGQVGGVHGHDLWPLPLTEECLAHVVARVSHVQDVLGRPLVLENVSSYLRATFDEKGEAEFLDELTQRAGCLLLVDVNNIVVSSHNHGFSSTAYLERLRPESVAYMHVAGHSIKEGYRFDDHASLPDAETVALLGRAFERFGNVPCIFEWDENLPDLSGYLRAAHDIDTTPGLRPAVLEQVTKG